jgi:hypothetical protein
MVVRPKLLIFSIWAFLLVTGTNRLLMQGSQGTEIEKEDATLSKWKAWMHVLAESIARSNESLSKSQQVQKMMFEKFCYFVFENVILLIISV